MLRVTELRIGNWIDKVSDDRSTTTTIVVDEDLLVSLKKGANDINFLSLIPITAEILKRAGLNERTDINSPMGNKFFEAEGQLIKVYADNNDTWIMHTGLVMDSIRYLHSLQNIYFDYTGKPLKITIW